MEDDRSLVLVADHPEAFKWPLLAVVWQQFLQEMQAEQWLIRSRTVGHPALVEMALCLALFFVATVAASEALLQERT